MEFAKAGYCVVINARNEDELKQTANDISKSINHDDGNKFYQYQETYRRNEYVYL